VTGPGATGAAPLRIGIVGVENSHAEHIVRHLNLEQRLPARVCALVTSGDDETARELARAGGIDDVVGDVDELLDRVDALIVTDRRGDEHLDHARPFLRAGRPVLVDKPMTSDARDAAELVALAASSGALLASFSGLRWLPPFVRCQDALPRLGELQTVIGIGPADPGDPNNGLHFYGSHAVNIALGLCPDGPVEDVRVRRTRAAIVATGTVGDVLVQVDLIKPAGPAHTVDFQLLALGTEGTVASTFELNDDYLVPTLDAFLGMIDGAVPVIPPARMIRDIAFLDAVVAQLR
jgi:predicted dehydrogenase